MCKGSKDKFGSIMEGETFQENFQENQIGDFCNSSILLELAAADDVFSFQSEVESKNLRLDDVGLWYSRTNGCNCKPKMGFQERTPLMIAALFGSVNVLKFILNAGKVNVNKASGSDGHTALHSAAAGGAPSAVDAVRILLDAGADPNLTDHYGNKPADLNNFNNPNNFKNLISRGVKSSIRKELGILLTGFCVSEDELFESGTVETTVESPVELAVETTVEMKKEYPVDVSLPDINDGVYGTDEFRMYMFKVKPCSRAYSHDWTECPFVHPGENARRRDPRKHGYSCVPCPDFRKGSCVKGDGCEYAHGVFESWLHPAQYRTRLCKDETGCARKVCFFAHKVEELRPLYASTGSAVPSPKSSIGLTEMGSMSPLGLGSTPPMSPSVAPLNWQNKNNMNNFVHLTPPALQLPGSRLKTSLHARDLQMEMELLQRQQMIDDLSTNFHNTRFGEFGEFAEFGERKPNNFDAVFGSPSRQQIRSDMDPLRSPYPSSPGRKPAGFGFDSSAGVAQAVMNSRASSFTSQRSRSFVDRGAGPVMSPRSMAQSPTYSDWGSRSPDGRVDWGFSSEDANKLRKSASFGIKSGNMGSPMKANREPDDPWAGAGLYSSAEKVPQWVEQMYIEQEQLIV